MLKFTVASEKTGRPIGFWSSTVASLSTSSTLISLSIGYLLPLWDANRQTLADMIMATVCLPTSATVSDQGSQPPKTSQGQIGGSGPTHR